MAETTNRARLAAVKRVSFQSKRPEPRITLTICARKTIKRTEAGKDQKIMNLAVMAICFLNSSRLLSLKCLDKVGKAASE